MAVFTPQQAIAEPTNWYERIDLPNLDDYTTLEEYNQALEDFLSVQNATPAYSMLSPASPNYGKSQAQIDAEALNRDVQYHQNGPGLLVALQNQINQGRPSIQSAYNAVDSDGSPLVADPLIAMLESLGVRPDAAITQPPDTASAGPPTTNGAGGPILPHLGMPEPGQDQGRRPDFSGASAGGPQLTVPPLDSIGAPGSDIGSGANPGANPGLNVPPLDAIGGPGMDTGSAPNPGFSGHLAGGQPDMDPLQEARQFGSPSTIDPRYPDWLLRYIQRAKQPPMMPTSASGQMNY